MDHPRHVSAIEPANESLMVSTVKVACCPDPLSLAAQAMQDVNDVNIDEYILSEEDDVIDFQGNIFCRKKFVNFEEI